MACQQMLKTTNYWRKERRKVSEKMVYSGYWQMKPNEVSVEVLSAIKLSNGKTIGDYGLPEEWAKNALIELSSLHEEAWDGSSWEKYIEASMPLIIVCEAAYVATGNLILPSVATYIAPHVGATKVNLYVEKVFLSLQQRD